MKDLFQIGLEMEFEKYGEWFYYPFPPALIISENHPNYDKILDLLDKEKPDD